MFAYCGNNPVHRDDSEGDSWVAVIGAVGMQYATDVLGNVMSGKKGVKALIPTSSLATYTAAAITALIPGGSLGKALLRSVVSEAILWTDNIRTGKSELNNLGKSCKNIVKNAALDFVTGFVLDNTFGQLGTEELSTYSSKSNHRSSGSNLQQTYDALQKSNTIGRAIGRVGTKVYEFAANYYFS